MNKSRNSRIILCAVVFFALGLQPGDAAERVRRDSTQRTFTRYQASAEAALSLTDDDYYTQGPCERALIRQAGFKESLRGLAEQISGYSNQLRSRAKKAEPGRRRSVLLEKAEALDQTSARLKREANRIFSALFDKYASLEHFSVQGNLGEPRAEIEARVRNAERNAYLHGKKLMAAISGNEMALFAADGERVTIARLAQVNSVLVIELENPEALIKQHSYSEEDILIQVFLFASYLSPGRLGFILDDYYARPLGFGKFEDVAAVRKALARTSFLKVAYFFGYDTIDGWSTWAHSIKTISFLR